MCWPPAPPLASHEDSRSKRNIARLKLSELSKSKFKDLAFNVYYELSRRYPEFKEAEVGGIRLYYDLLTVNAYSQLLPDTPETSDEEFSGKQDEGKPDQN